MVSIVDISVANYARVLGATIGVMEKGEAFFRENGVDFDDIVEMRFAPDMAKFPFQVNSLRHHTLGALEGMLAGEFNPPPKLPRMDYHGLTDYLKQALADIEAFDKEAINALQGKPMLFRMGKTEIPFSMENFILSFSLPNLYFHSTTIYDMLRSKGVQIGKMDFLGRMDVGLPSA